MIQEFWNSCVPLIGQTTRHVIFLWFVKKMALASPIDPSITEHTISLESCPGNMFYLASGPINGKIIIFIHGWPELSLSWRHQLSVLGKLGFRAIAPDMRGYGRSYIPTTHQEVEKRYNVNDLICLLDNLRGTTSKAVFIGHDWGGPIAWNLAQHFPDRVHGVGSLVVPATAAKHRNAPNAVDYFRSMDNCNQWDYQVHHFDHPKASYEELDVDIKRAVEAMFQATYTQPKPGAWNEADFVRMYDQVKRYKENQQNPSPNKELNSWFPLGLSNIKHLIKRDERVVTKNDVNKYVESIERNGGFKVPGYYYQNHQADDDYGRESINKGLIDVPSLMITAQYDTVCTPKISDNMENICSDLTRGHVFCGHWAQQEKPNEINAIIVNWLNKIGWWPMPSKM